MTCVKASLVSGLTSLADYVCSAPGTKLYIKNPKDPFRNFKRNTKAISKVIPKTYQTEATILLAVGIFAIAAYFVMKKCSEHQKNQLRNRMANLNPASDIHQSELDQMRAHLELPLHIVSYCKRPDEIQTLIDEHGKEIIDIPDPGGNTSLHWASISPFSGDQIGSFLSQFLQNLIISRYSKTILTNWLNELKIQPPENLSYAQSNKIIETLRNKIIETIRILLENGAKVGLKNKKGQTPLQTASLGDNTLIQQSPIMKLLIEKGADYYIEDADEVTLKYYFRRHFCRNKITEEDRAKLPESIPVKFENDKTYPQYKCPLTYGLIRHPVLDPTDGRTLYEKEVILRALSNKNESPITNKVLFPNQLLEVPRIKEYIEKRLVQDMKEFPDEYKAQEEEKKEAPHEEEPSSRSPSSSNPSYGVSWARGGFFRA